MLKGFLTEESTITVDVPTIAGTTTIDSTPIDTSNFDGVLFVVRFGTPAANNNIRGQQASTSGGSYADLQGTLVNDAAKNVHMLDLKRPGKQFLRVRITRGTSTSIDTITAITYRARRRPLTQPTSVLEQFISPPEGTA
jgi:hypothetical protein